MNWTCTANPPSGGWAAFFNISALINPRGGAPWPQRQLCFSFFLACSIHQGWKWAFFWFKYLLTTHSDIYFWLIFAGLVAIYFKSSGRCLCCPIRSYQYYQFIAVLPLLNLTIIPLYLTLLGQQKIDSNFFKLTNRYFWRCKSQHKIWTFYSLFCCNEMKRRRKNQLQPNFLQLLNKTTTNSCKV